MQREGEKGPITGRSVSDIEETTAKKLEPVFEEFRKVLSHIYYWISNLINSSMELILGLYNKIRQFVQPVINLINEKFMKIWNNFPPFRWLVYSVMIFNAIPFTIFLAWGIFTLAISLAIAGGGIMITEGFFILLGLSIFLPVAFVLSFISFGFALFLTLAWFGFKVGNTVSRSIGLTSQEMVVDVKGVVAGTMRLIGVGGDTRHA
ncbi:7767_t:CDS:1 [Diversispora eburnea]|uniref:7767_t:CDS:1 n=2 Tax=Diversisporales TaxID=214509 RepID=A0A9N8YK38_9GLOM